MVNYLFAVNGWRRRPRLAWPCSWLGLESCDLGLDLILEILFSYARAHRTRVVLMTACNSVLRFIAAFTTYSSLQCVCVSLSSVSVMIVAFIR